LGRGGGIADGYVDPLQLSRSVLTTTLRSRLIERLFCAMSPDECQAAMAAGAGWSEQEAIAAAQAA
jgi:hypothetical protein